MNEHLRFVVFDGDDFDRAAYFQASTKPQYRSEFWGACSAAQLGGLITMQFSGEVDMLVDDIGETTRDLSVLREHQAYLRGE